ncbi:MAG: UMP kinase [Candidatus Komeilibacteria bacterium]|jgi:uridylate kinase|nr:UMP kinase [Candidatus Komeilibacteria bacterium]MBT4447887.1 UMP kinase [Candidatus Komeilibacteria bacterium]
MKNKRIVIKLSGEVMEQGNQEANLDFGKIMKLADSLKKLAKQGYQIGVVLGGGNIFRARMVKNMEIDREVADHIGMTATMINAMALQAVLSKMKQAAKVLSPFVIPATMSAYSASRANSYLNKKHIVIFAAGTGKPYFTTDTALVLRAYEIGAEYIYKATNVRGVYDKDPIKYKNAKFYKKLSYSEALEKKLKVMDAAAFAMARENKMDLTVFKYSPANLIKAVTKNNIGTKVANESR